MAKFVFFLVFVISLVSLTLAYYLFFPFSLPFFYSFNRLRTFYLIIPNYLGYLNAPLPTMTGEPVLIPDLERLLET